ncbi:enoyl-CoA hydratase/isomerase family protein [Brevibacterium sp. CFH 10365]|uniref:enoyl-CoA hydratase/isomerase family protein n=1 Tax=Brevibacterium sp. CFH 10365 TaxID=2585207 RepID=UPI0039B6FF86
MDWPLTSSIRRRLRHCQRLATSPAAPNESLQADYSRGEAYTPANLELHRREIDRCFSAPTYDEVVQRLSDEHTNWADQVLSELAERSPQSLRITFEILGRGTERSLRSCLDSELRPAKAVTKSHDSLEGVRGVLVDKDKQAERQGLSSSETQSRIELITEGSEETSRQTS